MVRAIPAFLLSCTIAALLAKGGEARAQSDDNLLRWWVDAVANHTLGQVDEPARKAGALSRDQLLSILNDVTSTPSPSRAIRFGSVLHLDVALGVQARATGALFRSYPRTAPPPPPVPFLIVDGTGTGRGVSSTHLELARALIRKMQPVTARREFARVWYAASAAELARRRNFAELDVHLEHARDLLQDDPGILLASGCLHEVFAGPAAQAAARERVTLLIGDRATSLLRAERYFRQAVSADPALVEARLRLGRVLGNQKRHNEAITELQRAIASAEDSVQSYYALMFLGRSEESIGQADAARNHFARASALYPLAQSPRVALSRLALERGDNEGAQRVLEAVIDAAASDTARSDPWWAYDLGPGRYADRIMSRLYRALSEDER